MSLLRLRFINNTLGNALILFRNYAAKKTGAPTSKGATAMASFQRRKLPVETDAKRLVKYVCGSNIYKEGEDVKLKPDSEYPEWLSTVRTGKALPLEELDPNSFYYWQRVHRINKTRRLQYLKTKRVK